jgi:DNA-binding LytR/AlgR family response regulator
MADPTTGRTQERPRRMQVRIVAGSLELEAAMRQLIVGVPLEVAVDWSSDGESGAESPIQPQRYARRLPVPMPGHRIRYLKVETIVWIEAESQYVRLHVKDRSFLVREPTMTLRLLESRLDPEQFVRVNRSHIVNLEWIVALRTEAPAKRYVLLPGGRELPVSPSRWERLQAALAGG